jgi:hypothetical protein
LSGSRSPALKVLRESSFGNPGNERENSVSDFVGLGERPNDRPHCGIERALPIELERHVLHAAPEGSGDAGEGYVVLIEFEGW